MALYRVRPAPADIEIANAVAEYTSPEIERVAEALTWGADEHVQCALAAAWWLYCRDGSTRERVGSNHLLLTTVAVTLLPYLLKRLAAAGSPHHPRPFARRSLFGKTRGRLSIRPCHACRRARIRRNGTAARKTQSRLVGRWGAGSDPDRIAGALGR